MSRKVKIGIIGSRDRRSFLLPAIRSFNAEPDETDEIDSVRSASNDDSVTCWIIFPDINNINQPALNKLTKRSPVLALFNEKLLPEHEKILLSCGVQELLDISEFCEKTFHKAVEKAILRFDAFEDTRTREIMFNNLCDALPFQMSYRIEVRPGEKAKFIYVSDGIRHISGLSREDVLKDPEILYRQIIPQDREKLKRLEDIAVKTLTPFEIEVRKKDTNGKIRWVHIRSFPQVKPDGTIIWDGVESNINKYKRAEESVKELLSKNEFLLASERQAREESENNSRMKDEFLATLSHELRTPINAVLGWSQLMKRGLLSEEDMKKAVDIVERNARAQAQLITDLLDMSKIISGKINLNTEDINIHQFVVAAIESIIPSAEAKNIKITASFSMDLNISLIADTTRLQQIMANLLSNAVKFTPTQGSIHIKVEDTGKNIVFSVKDSGIGIKKEFLTEVFEKFRQADSSFSRNFGGLGLGLAIVKHLTVLHGGTVWAESGGEGKGSVFYVSLPKSAYKQQEIKPRLSLIRERPADSFSFHKAKILIVDDEPDSLTLLKQILEERGAEVTAVNNAETAYLLLTNDDTNFDLLISDIGMPAKDGLQFLKEVRSSISKAKNIPAIALTAFARQEDRLKAIEAGYQFHLSKPLNQIELLTSANSLFKKELSQAVNS